MNSFENHVNKHPLNIAICPLCGEPNQCAMAADTDATACWCEGVVFPEALLAQIPTNAVRKTCVCQKCLTNFQESGEGADKPS